MNKQYYNDDQVYKFYFDWKTCRLNYKKLLVVSYNYMDELQWNVVDEYILRENFTIKKFFIFKEKKFHTHRICSHLISDDYTQAKIKFLYHFLKEVGDNKDFSSYKLNSMIIIARRLYNEYVEKTPDLILKAVTTKLTNYKSLNSFLY